jgi:hypothetical protein
MSEPTGLGAICLPSTLSSLFEIPNGLDMPKDHSHTPFSSTEFAP